MKTLTVIAFAAISCCAFGQIYDTNNVVVQTFAGTGASGFKDGQGTQATFRSLKGIVADSAGNLFVLDEHRIRKITTPDATVSSFALGGSYEPPGYGTNVSLEVRSPSTLFEMMAVDHSNALWVTGYANVGSQQLVLVRIGSDAYVSLARSTPFAPNGLCLDSWNNVYVSQDNGNGIFRSYTNWISLSSFRPSRLAADAADNIYAWDSANFVIRKISQNQDIATIAGRVGINSNSDGVSSQAAFNSVSAMTLDEAGNVILACGTSIRKVTPTGNVTTIAGSFAKSGYDDGPGSNALFNVASGVCVSQGAIFVADSGNNRIRKITFTPVGQSVSGANLSLNLYPGLQISGTVGRSYRVESSTDMNTWREETKLLLPSSPYLWIDQTGIGAKKFYRAFLQP